MTRLKVPNRLTNKSNDSLKFFLRPIWAGSAQDRFHRGDKFKVEAMSFAKLRLGIYYLRKSGFLVFLNNQINVY